MVFVGLHIVVSDLALVRQTHILYHPMNYRLLRQMFFLSHRIIIIPLYLQAVVVHPLDDGGYIRDASTVFCRLPVCMPTPGIASVVIGGLHYIANGDFVTPSDNPANLQLNQDWQIAINWSASGDDRSSISKPNSSNGCEFTCND